MGNHGQRVGGDRQEKGHRLGERSAILGLCASTGFASAQATNVSPYSGGARAYYGGGDVPGQRWRHSRAMARSYWVPGDYYGPRRHYGYYGY